jgi:hypothetical protein
VSGEVAAEGDYLQVPHAYWAAEMQDWADLPTKAVPLIALSLQDDFPLPLDRGPHRYGLSRDTIRTGLRGLLTRGFLRVRSFRKPHRYPRRDTRSSAATPWRVDFVYLGESYEVRPAVFYKSITRGW